MIEFVFKPRKLASAVAYMAWKKPELAKTQLCKLLFFADKQHLLTFGRTITGDRYYALEQGPAPAHELDATWGEGAAPDLKPLSKSDLDVLDETLRLHGNLPAWKLEELAFCEPAWMGTRLNTPIDFELFFSGHPEADLVKSIVEDEHAALIPKG